MGTTISTIVTYIQLYRDIAITCTGIFLASLYPKLQVPLVDLQGKTAIVTGSNSGIGLAIAEALAKRNATVYLACRNVEKGQQAATQIIDACGGDSSKRVHVLELDTSSLVSVRAFAKTWSSRASNVKTIDLLYHNAGISSAPKGQDITAEGLDMIYATNFLGSFLLTSLLEPHLANNARVISTSSQGQYATDWQRLFNIPRLAPKSTYGPKPADSASYADTKGMQVAFARLLQQRFDSAVPDRKLTAHAFSPGYTFTPIFGKFTDLPWYVDPPFWFLKVATVLATPVEQGAATGVWLGVVEHKELMVGGQYWDRCTKRRTMVDVLPQGMLERMWQLWCVDAGAQWEEQ